MFQHSDKSNIPSIGKEQYQIPRNIASICSFSYPVVIPFLLCEYYYICILCIFLRPSLSAGDLVENTERRQELIIVLFSEQWGLGDFQMYFNFAFTNPDLAHPRLPAST